jgi:hypothetical protein
MAQGKFDKINFLYHESMMLGSGYMCTRGLREAFQRIGVLNYAYDTMGDAWLDEKKFQEAPIFYIRGFLPGRVKYVLAGGSQFKSTLQSESYYTRHGSLDTSSTHIRAREKEFGLFITFAETDLNIYRVPTVWMPSWADITVLDDIAPPEYDQLGFIGGLPGRYDWFQQDKEGIVLQKQTELHKDPLINARRYTELINKFKILVAPPGRFFNSMTGRVFEIMACRRLCLAYFNPDTMYKHAELFEDGVDLVYWRTFDEMVEKFKYYRDNPAEMWQIADNGYNKVRKFYNQDIMAKYIAEQVLVVANGGEAENFKVKELAYA